MSYYLGSTPCEEECASVGDDHFRFDARIETTAFINQLNRTFVVHKPALGVYYKKKRESHDYGSYSEVVVDFTGDPLQQASSVACTIENHVPAMWDLTAIQQIIQKTACKFFETEELNGRLSWMCTPIVSVDQGRRVLSLIRKQRSGVPVTPNEALAASTPEPDETPVSDSDVLKRFHLVVAEAGEDGAVLEFECMAEDAEHAAEQANSAYPGSEVLMHFQSS